MKLNLTLIFALLLSACSLHPTKTGQRFSDNDPSFYLSIAPSFESQFEYEITENSLFFRKYSGLGGYKWGKSKEQSKKILSVEQEKTIRKLALKAISESIQEELAGIDEVVVMDGTKWYLLTDFGAGSFLSTSTNKPSSSFYELHEYLESLLK